MARGAPGVPLVAMPEDGDVRALPLLDGGDVAAAAQACERLRALAGVLCREAGRCQASDDALEAALAAARTLARRLDRAHPSQEALEAVETPPHPEYFGLRRLDLSHEAIAASGAWLLLRALGDMRWVQLDVNHLAAEVAGMVKLTERLARVAPAPDAAGPGGGPTPAFEPSGDGVERWICVHQFYFLLNLHAAGAVREAVAALAAGREDAAVASLEEATVYVRAFTGAMLHSAALPAVYYEESVRDGMRPPSAPMALTGAMQVEHASYRRAMDGLLEARPEPFLELARRHRHLALAREALLETDLVDIEHHVLVAHALVGTGRSLVQHDRAPDNAVKTLREMRHARAARYCDLVRFGDTAHAAAGGLRR